MAHFEGLALRLSDLLQREVACREAQAAAPAAQEGECETMSNLYSVQLGSAKVGMTVIFDGEGRVQVSQLKSDPTTGEPLAAKACGHIKVGDEVVAVASRPLAMHTTLEAVAAEFAAAPRPLTLLLRRTPPPSVDV